MCSFGNVPCLLSSEFMSSRLIPTADVVQQTFYTQHALAPSLTESFPTALLELESVYSFCLCALSGRRVPLNDLEEPQCSAAGALARSKLLNCTIMNHEVHL